MYDRERYGTNQGQYSDIQRESWQPITFQAGVLVPVGQAGVIAFSCGLVITILALVLCNVAGWPAKWGLLAGGLGWSILLAWRSIEAINWTRGAYLARERYRAAKEQGAQADKTVISIQWTDPKANNGYSKTIYEDLDVTPEQLAIVARSERLSKRGLMEAGLSDTQSMKLLTQLLALGYILRTAGNEPASWTAKGAALRRAISGGGGGGGVVVDVPTSDKAEWGRGER